MRWGGWFLMNEAVGWPPASMCMCMHTTYTHIPAYKYVLMQTPYTHTHTHMGWGRVLYKHCYVFTFPFNQLWAEGLEVSGYSDCYPMLQPRNLGLIEVIKDLDPNRTQWPPSGVSGTTPSHHACLHAASAQGPGKGALGTNTQHNDCCSFLFHTTVFILLITKAFLFRVLQAGAAHILPEASHPWLPLLRCGLPSCFINTFDGKGP